MSIESGDLRSSFETILSSYQSLVHYDFEFKVLVCIQCRVALVRSSLARHFRRAHNFKIGDYKDIMNHAIQFGLPKKHDDLLQVPDYLNPRVGLTIVQGWRYKICLEFKTDGRDQMQRHISIRSSALGMWVAKSDSS